MRTVLVLIWSPMFAFLMPAMPVIGEKTFAQLWLSWALSSTARAWAMSARDLATPACAFARLARAAFSEARFARLACTALSSSCWLIEPRSARGV